MVIQFRVLQAPCWPADPAERLMQGVKDGNVLPPEKVKTEPFYVAIITPVTRYCMGGLEMDVSSAVYASNEDVVPGLYAAGELPGGVNNRLGGNSLLDCVVWSPATHAGREVIS